MSTFVLCTTVQVKYQAAKDFSRAAKLAAARAGGGVSATDRAYQEMLQDSSQSGVHPMMRLIADAAPQRGEAAMRSGRSDEVGLLSTILDRLKRDINDLYPQLVLEVVFHNKLSRFFGMIVVMLPAMPMGS